MKKAKTLTVAPNPASESESSVIPEPAPVICDKYERAYFPIEKIENHENFSSGRFDMVGITDLKASLVERGLLNPVLVWEFVLDNPIDHPQLGKIDKRYFLIAGFRRMTAIRQIRAENPEAFKEIPVSIFRGSYDDAILENLSENVQREDVTPMEVGAQLMKLEVKMTQAEMAQKLGKSLGWINFAIRMAKGDRVCENLTDLVRERKIGFWTALQISFLDIEIQKKVSRRISDAYKEGKGAEEVRKIVKEIQDEKPPKRRNVRSVAELREKLQAYMDQDMSDLDPVQISHLYGFMKALFWALNYDIPLDKVDIDDWMPPEFLEKAESEAKEEEDDEEG